MMAQVKGIYILIIKVIQVVFLFSLQCFLKEIEHMFSVFLLSFSINLIAIYLNNRVFLSRNYRLIVARGNLMFLKQLFAREAKLRRQIC